MSNLTNLSVRVWAHCEIAIRDFLGKTVGSIAKSNLSDDF